MFLSGRKRNIRFSRSDERGWNHLLYPLMTCIAIIGIFFMLPGLGRYLSAANSRVYLFLKNIYHAQEYALNEASLQEQLALTRQNLIETKKLEEENTLLRSELQIKELRAKASKEKMSFVNAWTIGKGFAFGSDIIVIDEGITAGIHPGDGVIKDALLIGIIATVLPDRSYVRLISDTSFQIPAASIQGTRGVIKGGLGGQVVFDEISQGSQIKENDTIVTTNEITGIPAGLIIGQVGKILSHPADIVKKTQIIASFDPYLLDVVGVINQ